MPVAFLAQQIVQAAQGGPDIFAVFPVQAGNAPLDHLKAPFDLIDQIQHILFPAGSAPRPEGNVFRNAAFRVGAAHLLPLLFMSPLTCADPLHPGGILPHFLQPSADVRLINIEIVAGFQDVVFALHHLFHIALQMLPQKLPVILLFQEPGKKAVHIVEHILQRPVQLSGVDQGGPQHGQVHARVIFKGKKSGVHVLNINLGVLLRFAGEAFKGLDHHGGIIRNDDVRRHGGIILHPAQPAKPQKAVQNPSGRRLLRLLVRFLFLPFQPVSRLGAQIGEHLQAGLPA